MSQTQTPAYAATCTHANGRTTPLGYPKEAGKPSAEGVSEAIEVPDHLVARAERQVALAELRAAIKVNKYVTIKSIADRAGNTAGFVSLMLKGDYPFHESSQLSKKVRVAIESAGFVVAPCLVNF